MRFVRYDGNRLGLRQQDGITDLTEPLDLGSDDPLLEIIRQRIDVGAYRNNPPDAPVDTTRIESPIQRPGKVIAMSFNYPGFADQLGGRQTDYVIEAPSSVIGSDDPIILPFPDRVYLYEVELGFIVGEPLTDVTDPGRALDGIFGYTIVIDVTMRGDSEVSVRKSHDTFTVVGPTIVTPDEVRTPDDLQLMLDVNGNIQQSDTTASMKHGCAEIVKMVSSGMTLEPGDIVATGTPDGVGCMSDGDRLYAEIENVGSMTVNVESDFRAELDNN